jgi:hypothetical protein
MSLNFIRPSTAHARVVAFPKRSSQAKKTKTARKNPIDIPFHRSLYKEGIISRDMFLAALPSNVRAGAKYNDGLDEHLNILRQELEVSGVEVAGLTKATIRTKACETIRLVIKCH